MPGDSHDSVKALMRARGLVDVLIPRGGAGLIRSVVEESTVPVIETGVGNCHVYVDASADLEQALSIVVNAKTHRTSVCNAAESLLVHADIADDFLPLVIDALHERDVTIHGDDRFSEYDGVVEATEEDYGTEYLSLDISAAVVDDVEAAIEHIRTHSSGHTDAIVARDQGTIRRFIAVGRLGSRAGQRLDALHGRWRVRLRRRDRHQHPEAARPRADGPAGDDVDEVRRHRRRPHSLRHAAPPVERRAQRACRDGRRIGCRPCR